MSDYESITNLPDNSDISKSMNNLGRAAEEGVQTSGERFSKENKSKILFWSENPNIILNTQYLFEFFPTDTMSYSQKLNPISRLVLA